MNELLQNAVNMGIINISDVQEKMTMNKIKEVLKLHNYKVWQGDNGFWYTYLPDESKNNGRRLVKKKTKEKIDETLLLFYDTKSEEKCITFKDCFESYVEMKSIVVSNNTINKYKSDYKRYFYNFQ